MKVCISLASWPGLRHEQAAQHMAAGVISEPCFGDLSTEHVQLVPQSFGILSEGLAEGLRHMFPTTRFRLHANVRLMPTRCIADLSAFALHRDWFDQAARISRGLDAPAYTLHPGLHAEASLVEVIENARRCADLFACPVGIEGQYPTNGDELLMSTWQEYRLVFESGVPYAIDLSHVHILATRSRQRETSLLQEMLACERCIEVHVSDNDGTGDWHQVCDGEPWWLPLLNYIHNDAVVFSEGNHRRTRSKS